MDLLVFLDESFLILVPILYILGEFIKRTALKDKYIPTALTLVSIGLSISIGGFSSKSVVQGILATGLAVLGNQYLKQLKKDE